MARRVLKKQVTLIGFYSHAHPQGKMDKRVDNAVGLLENKNIEVNFIGHISDHDDMLAEQARKKLEDTIKGSSCIVLVFSGWCESTTILKIISNYLHLPVIIWSLAGYYEGSGLIAPAAAAGASLLKNTFENLNTKHVCIYDSVDRDPDVETVISYVNLFSIIREFRNFKIASFGYACSNLYPFMYDGNLIKKYTGIHVDNLDLLELKMASDEISINETKDFKDDFHKRFDIKQTIPEKEVEALAKYYKALEKIIDEQDYKGISMKCGSGPGKLLDFTPCMLLSLIGDKVNSICEDDIYGLVAQTLINHLTGQRPMFLEIFEFYKNSILMASCGYAPFSLCKKDCINIYKGNWGGCGNIMNISELKTGKITLFNLFPRDGRLLMQLFKGTGTTSREFQEEGWQDHKGPKIPAMEIELDSDMADFKKKVRGPHYIIVHGDHTDTVSSLCEFTGIELETFN